MAMHNTTVGPIFGTKLDRKNGELKQAASNLRQNLDIHRLLSLNWADIKKCCGAGQQFFLQVHNQAVESIVLDICKIYEKEGGYELNSVDGIIRDVCRNKPKLLNGSAIKNFVERYDGSSAVGCPFCALESATDRFRKKHKADLKGFKKARDKIIAHSEHAEIKKVVPSFSAMEELFSFASDFYAVIYRSFIGNGPVNLWSWRPVEVALGNLLKQIGIANVKTNWEQLKV